MAYLGVDIGTTGCKAVVFDESGRAVSTARRNYALASPQPGLWELDAEAVWQLTRAAIREAAGAAPGHPVEALAVSALGEAVVAVDSMGRPLAGAPVSADFRAGAEAAELEARLGRERIYEITGHPAGLIYSLPKMMWWRRQRPDLHARTWKYLCFEEYAFARMGLPPVTDHSLAARTLAFDSTALCWSAELLEVAGIDAGKLPDTAPSGTCIGRLGAAAATDLGLVEGVAVCTGGFDQACGALGIGVETPGQAYYGIGTTEALAIVLDRPQPGLAEINMAVCPHAIAGRSLAMGGSQTGSRLLQWYRDELAGPEVAAAQADGTDPFERIIATASPGPSDLLFLPHFTGSGTFFNDPLSTGTILGLTFRTRRQDIAKAVLEAASFDQALILKRLGALGIGADMLHVVGGGTRARNWLQIKANIMGCPLRTGPDTEASCLGAAKLAHLGATGTLPGAAWAVPEGTVATIPPEAAESRAYRAKLELYERLYHAVAPVSHDLQASRH